MPVEQVKISDNLDFMLRLCKVGRSVSLFVCLLVNWLVNWLDLLVGWLVNWLVS